MLLPLALLFAIHALVELVVAKVRPRDRALAIHGGVVAAIFVFLVAVWALTSRGYFWPAWTLLGLASALVVHYLITRSQRRDRLARRVETLETTRLGAVDAQAAELRRIERDLHDGAQARLVALGMSLGMAEDLMAGDYRDGAKVLLAEARGVVDAGAVGSCGTWCAASTRRCSLTAGSARRSRRSPTAAR